MRQETVWGNLLKFSCMAILLMLVASPAAYTDETPVWRVNECNSDITISQLPATAAVGATSTVTLELVSTEANDAGGTAISQTFDKVTYTGDCQQPVGVPCTANMPAAVMYLGNVGGTCPGVVANPMGDGVVEFDFVPDLTLNPPNPAGCTIPFDVTYSAAGTYAVQANTLGMCQGGTFQSDTTVTTVADAVPTMGEVALLALALLLVGGSWAILRRRQSPAAVLRG